MFGGLWSSGYEGSPSVNNKPSSNQDSSFPFGGGIVDGYNSYSWDLNHDTSSSSTAGKLTNGFLFDSIYLVDY